MIEHFEIRQQMNDETEELVSLRSEVAELEEQNTELGEMNERQAQTIAELQNDIAELESLRSEVEEKEITINELEGVISSLEADCDDLQRENDELIATVGAVDSDNYALTEAIRDALEDLRTLPEVPLNLVEPAVENIISDLRKVLGID